MPPAAIAVAGLAVSAASTAAAYQGQQQAANAQSSYNKQQYAAVKKAAQQNYYQQVAAIQTRSDQDIAQTKQQAQGDMVTGEKAKASAKALAADRGVTGNSVDALLNDFGRIEHNNQATLDTNLTWRLQQYQADEKQAQSEGQQRIAGAAPAPVAFPSALAAGLQIGGSALNTYNQIQNGQHPNPYANNPVVPPPPAGT